MESLRVVHLTKSPSRDEGLSARLQTDLSGAFHLDSCQRLLWICRERELSAVAAEDLRSADVFEGADAYLFLLRVATGLESQIVGETDIFGQLTEAGRKTRESNDSGDLGLVMQRLFEDTKDIRSRYLQNLGGSSYGTLVRMMLKQSPGPRLMVGAGQLAQSVAPYLLDQELWLLNRSAENLDALRAALASREPAPGLQPRIRVISKEEEAQAWRQAASVVVCIPFDPAKARRARGLARRSRESRRPRDPSGRFPRRCRSLVQAPCFRSAG